MSLTRRGIVAGAAATALAASTAQAQSAPMVKLRLLETSDLHMFADDFDYYRDVQDATVGLSKVATLIRAARTQARNSLLFDNGDIIQGNPLGDWVAQDGHLPEGAVHPMFRGMHAIGYDAATVGNHEFNYGLPFLARSLGGAAFPFLCANVTRADGGEFLPPFTVLEREMLAEDGTAHRLRIGVIGFVTPQIMVWDRRHPEGRLRAGDIVAAAEKYVPQLRAQCDLVVALCHSGISTAPRGSGDENASFHLAQVPGIDAIFTGHSHRVFPGPDYAGRPGIDAVRGTLAGIPAVMPGFWGSHLGIIDLALHRQAEGWRVADFKVEARPIYRREAGRVVSLVANDAAVVEAVAADHNATRAWVSQPLGRITQPIRSYFSMIGDASAINLVNDAQLWYARPLLAGTPHAGLPLLSAAAPFKAGYTPDYWVDIPPGPIALKNIADIYLYPNTVTLVRVSGAVVREWLERAAGVFAQIDPQRDEPQELLNRQVPTYNFDILSGLTWRIDLTQPARYNGDGAVVQPEHRRIVDLRHGGQAIDLAQDFIVVTNNYRADGGGKFPGLTPDRIVLRAPDPNRDAIGQFLQSQASLAPAIDGGWSFEPSARRLTLAFDSATSARAYLSERPGLAWLGDTPTGYGRFALTLDARPG
jgi:2',3'-cyclic-nucleotide 2'-phosphodiesterase/3'-nucleotidase